MGNAELEVIRDQYAAVNERDWERAMSHYAADVELVVPGAGIRAGTFEGTEAVGEWFGDWMRTFDRDIHFEIRELRELADGSIFLIADHRARGRVSGIELSEPVIWRYRVEAGKIVRVEGFESLEQALRIVGREGRA